MEVIHHRDLHAAVADPVQFTGGVMRTDFLQPADEHSLSGIRMSYEPGARSFWHVHDEEQVIVCIAGVGLVSWRGLEAPHLLEEGDWWHVTPGVPHWHGSAPDTHFIHLAITAGGGTQWLGEVSESDYRRPPT